MFIILIRHWTAHDVYIYVYIRYVYIGGYVNKPGVTVVFGAEERQSETSVLGERLYLRNGVFNGLYLLRHD